VPSRGNLCASAVLILAAVLACGSSAAAATLRGTVTVSGRASQALDAAGAVVWLDGGPGGSRAPERAVIDTREKRFLPTVTVVPVGSTVSFPNSDPILHNVFSVSGGNRFDLGLYGRGEGRDVVLSEPGVVRVFCNVHPQMEAFVVVTPGVAVLVGSDGSFEIRDAPAGRYDVRVWDERGGTAMHSVEVSGSETVTVDFRLDASSWRRRPHLDKNGRPYAARERY
jgi:plastocyanin